MPKVFISYVRDNSDQVDKLADELRHAGVTVWLDRNEILPGADWKYAIRQAIRKGDYFIACFSAEYVARPLTYMNTEIGLAVEMLEQMPPGRIWFIPVLLSECEIPDRTIGGGQTLRDLQWEPLHKDRVRGVRRVLKAMGVERKVYEPELIRIPAGEFLMGDDKHPVDVAEFYIGKYPVTNKQYEAFVQATFYGPDFWSVFEMPAGSVFEMPAGKENHPVVYVSWHDAVAFCEWLSKDTGRMYRLPTEDEWEKAARGTDGREYPWGNEPPAKRNGRCNFFDSGIGNTTRVDGYPEGASPYGVLDMAGNVLEWTDSLYDQSDIRHGVRGGSYWHPGRYVRCACRNYVGPDLSDDNVGFRVCAVIQQE